MAERELLRQPAFQTESRNHDGLGGERVAQRRPQDSCADRIGEPLETIAGMKMEAGFRGHLPAPYHKLSDKRCPTNPFFSRQDRIHLRSVRSVIWSDMVRPIALNPRRHRARKIKPEVAEQFSRPPLARMMQLHAQLQARKFPNCRKLAHELEVSAKTIQRDIEFMRYQLGLPIEYDQLHFGFVYTEPVANFPNIQVTRG